MRPLLFALALSLAPLAARADAIMPFDGECPPGLEHAVRDHAEVCSPAACRTSHDCPRGSSCEVLFQCWAERPVASGRLADAEPRKVEMPVGPCAEGHHCSEGVCRERRQCEPTEATAAWDRRERRWTREAYVASCGCSVGAHRGALPPLALWLALCVMLRRSR